MPLDRRWWAVTLLPVGDVFDAERGAAVLYAEGAAGVEWDDGERTPDPWADEPPPPGDRFVRAYFPDDATWPARRRRLRRRAAAAGFRLATRSVAETDWSRAWQQYWHAVRPGQLLWVVPAWEDPPDPDAPVIRLDPGMAFGTGAHPTTALAVAAMETWLRPGGDWIDVGTGSGILALAAWRLGARRVDAVEPDPVAVRVARANFAAHGAPIRLHAGTLASVAEALAPADGIAANLTERLLVEELPRLLRISRPKALWVCSGILSDRGESWALAIRDAGVRVLERSERDGWACWVVEAP
jgi:ribosomal protein L11 methyltransferase